MAELRCEELPYPEDVAELFAPLAERPWSLWLDSGGGGLNHARYDILLADPYATLTTRNGETLLEHLDGGWCDDGDPFALLRGELAKYPSSPLPDIPFAGGAAGYFSYDLARRIESLPSLAQDDLQMPMMQIGLYDWALVVDHQQRRCRLVSWQHRPETAGLWDALCQGFSAPRADSAAPLRVDGALCSNMDEAAYATGFARIQRYLREGDCYQVNFAQRFAVSVAGEPFASYRRLRAQSPAPFGAYFNTPDGQLLCNSPERFLRVTQGQVETAPIKGTRPRMAEPQQDAQQRQQLLHSAKDRAENVMIVDLLRNDLSKVCEPGSIRVPELFRVESYATVHQLISRVQGQLRAGEDALSLLRHCFPGGSITGAPKLRAMQIIESLEPHRRGIYCGSIACIGFDGHMDSNIVIRTALHQAGQLYYSAGGGIVSDSECEAEYQETFHKAAAFFRMLELPTG